MTRFVHICGSQSFKHPVKSLAFDKYIRSGLEKPVFGPLSSFEYAFVVVTCWWILTFDNILAWKWLAHSSPIFFFSFIYRKSDRNAKQHAKHHHELTISIENERTEYFHIRSWSCFYLNFFFSFFSQVILMILWTFSSPCLITTISFLNGFFSINKRRDAILSIDVFLKSDDFIIYHMLKA